MKASFRLVLAALATSAALTACTKEITSPNFENDMVNLAAEGSRVIAVSFAAQTKTYLDNDGFQPKFANRDSILISNGKAVDTCEVKIDDKTGTATISTILTGLLTAVYPYKAAGLNGDNPYQIDTVLVSTEQSGKFSDANICMARMTGENEESLSFENKTAVFCITPGAGDNTEYVEVSAKNFSIANDYPTGSTHTSLDTIHVNTTSADSVYVSILVPNGLTAGALSFSDGINLKAVTGDKADKPIAVNTIYSVTVDMPYVTIGGKNWATMNLGATTVAGNSSTCYGDLYSWGETSTKANYGGSYYSSDAKGISTDITPISGYDVARVKLGGNWRMPTSQDFKDLYDACGGTNSPKTGGDTSTTTQGVYWCNSYDGVAGLLFCDGAGHKLFFPAAGYSNSDSRSYGGSFGFCWSSTWYGSDDAYYLGFNSDGVLPQYSYYRFLGFSVRPVSDL